MHATKLSKCVRCLECKNLHTQNIFSRMILINGRNTHCRNFINELNYFLRFALPSSKYLFKQLKPTFFKRLHRNQIAKH